jgi:hypothetical protein
VAAPRGDRENNTIARGTTPQAHKKGPQPLRKRQRTQMKAVFSPQHAVPGANHAPHLNMPQNVYYINQISGFYCISSNSPVLGENSVKWLKSLFINDLTSHRGE